MFIVVQLGNINQSIDDLHMNSIQRLFEFERYLQAKDPSICVTSLSGVTINNVSHAQHSTPISGTIVARISRLAILGCPECQICGSVGCIVFPC
jgi:hypothetical protein